VCVRRFLQCVKFRSVMVFDVGKDSKHAKPWHSFDQDVLPFAVSASSARILTPVVLPSGRDREFTKPNLARDQFPTRGDKAVRAQSIRGRWNSTGFTFPCMRRGIRRCVRNCSAFPPVAMMIRWICSD